MPKSVDNSTSIRRSREASSSKPTGMDRKGASSHQVEPIGVSQVSVANSDQGGPSRLSQMPSNGHVPISTEIASSAAHQPTNTKLATSLSGRQLLNQRLQKYKLPAIFRANLVGPAQEPRWKGSFWIKGTLLGSSQLEHSKTAAKEGAAMSALKWLNNNHYY